MSFLRMNRTGRVTTTQSGPNQCKNTAHGKFAYEVRIICHAGNRDERGFIVDNMLIQGVAEDVFAGPDGAKSCEDIACVFANRIEDLAIECHVLPIDVYVKIYPIDDGTNPVDPGNVAWFEHSTSGKF